MAETLKADLDASFCLPTHFLPDDDFLLAGNNNPTTFDLFSTGFDPFAPPHSALHSPVSSTHKNNKEEDDEFLAELTRQLAHSSLQQTARYNTPEKPWLFSTSPQSTLSGFGPWSNRSGFSSNGSPNGPSRVPSPPLTPPGAKNDAAWDLLYEAAGEVARLKMNALATAAQLNHNHHNRHNNRFYDFPNTNQFQAVKRENCNCPHYATLGLPHSAWPPLGGGGHHNNHRTVRQQPPPEVGMRRQSVGTGVFLPRRPGTQQQQQATEGPRRKAVGSPVLIPARVVQSLNLNHDEINAGANLNSNPRFGRGFLTNHEIMMAKRNLFMENQRRRNGAPAATMAGLGHHEVSLPNDWTY